MATQSLNIRRPNALVEQLNILEIRTLAEAEKAPTLERVQNTLKINGAEVSVTVTPSVQPGRYYRLFRVNGKRIPKSTVPQVLLPTPA